MTRPPAQQAFWHWNDIFAGGSQIIALIAALMGQVTVLRDTMMRWAGQSRNSRLLMALRFPYPAGPVASMAGLILPLERLPAPPEADVHGSYTATASLITGSTTPYRRSNAAC